MTSHAERINKGIDFIKFIIATAFVVGVVGYIIWEVVTTIMGAISHHGETVAKLSIGVVGIVVGFFALAWILGYLLTDAGDDIRGWL